MVKLLYIAGWKQVLVGYDKGTKIVVLKECDVEEFGAIMVRPVTSSKKDKRSEDRAAKCRLITIGHLVKSMGLTTSKGYRAERSGNMILLRAMDLTKSE